MNLIIPPFPDFTLADSAFNQIGENPATHPDNDILRSNKWLIALEFPTGQKKLLKTRPIVHEGISYVAPTPNPVHLFLESAIEQHVISNTVSSQLPQISKKFGDRISLLPFGNSETNTHFNEFIKCLSACTIMLTVSVEAFCNQVIPSDHIYRREGTAKSFDINDIESTKISLKEKIEFVIPSVLGSTVFWESRETELKLLKDLIELRNQVTHVKTKGMDDISKYFEDIDQLMNYNFELAIKTVMQFYNSVKSNYVKIIF